MLNPGDACLVTAYLTNPTKDLNVDVSTTTESTLSWGIRVTGLNEITLINKNLGNRDLVSGKIKSVFEAFSSPYVLLTGKKLVATWILAVINFALLVHLMVLRGHLKLKPWKVTSLIVVGAALSAGCSECIATYIYSDPIANMMQYFFEKYDMPLGDWGNHLFNLPPIILYVSTLGYFLFAPRSNKSKHRMRNREAV